MPAGSHLILLHDGSFDGFLTAVLEAYRRKPHAAGIDEAGCQQQLDARYEEVETNAASAARVAAGMERTMGALAYEKLWTAFLSDDAQKSQALYDYIRLGMQVGRTVHTRLYDDRVQRVERLSSLVGREAGKLIEFVRFGRLEGGVWYAKIAPQYPVLPMLMPHFAARFNDMPFLLHDDTHGQVAVYNLKGWQIISDETMQLPPYAADEAEFRRLWKCFYDAIAIRERINPALRRQFMPKKYWSNITELQPDFPRAQPDSPALPEDLPANIVK